MTRIAPPTPPAAFPDVKPFPGENTAIAGIGHNEPPLEERIVLDLEAQIDETPGLRTRIRDLIAKADALPDCADQETAGKLADFVKMAKTAAGRVDEIREAIKRPYLTAGRNLDAKARTYADALAQAESKARAKINAFVAEQDRKRREAEAARIAAERAAWQAEQDRIAAEVAAEQERLAAERAALPADESAPVPSPPPPAPVFVAPPPEPPPSRPAPIATGDYGARVGTRKVWKHTEIADFKGAKALPKEILAHPRVLEAINSVIAAQIRTGIREIKGVTIFETTESSIR